MNRGDDSQGAEFVQLDRAAHHLLAAAHDIDTTDLATTSFFEDRQSSNDDVRALAQVRPEPPTMLIKRIFAVGLQLTALECLLDDGALKDRAAAAVGQLDLVIRDIRSDWPADSSAGYR